MTLGIASRVRIAGVVSPDELPNHIAAFDVAVQPEAVSYASPLKIFEYMSAGCAIIAPDQSNIREILTNDHNALLVPPEQFGSAILRLLDDPELCLNLGNVARNTIKHRRLTWDHNAEHISQIIELIYEKKRSPATESARALI
jgi:glycosyltransferase involved in cell wall biosynthesis